MASSAQSCCCGCDDCACISETPCPYCDVCPGTPSTFSVTFAGLVTCAGASHPSEDYNGTFELTLSGCQWIYDDGFLQVILNKSTAAAPPLWQITLKRWVQPSPPAPNHGGLGLLAIFLAQGFLLDNNCCQDFSANNSFTSCSGASEAEDGTVTGTVCS